MLEKNVSKFTQKEFIGFDPRFYYDFHLLDVIEIKNMIEEQTFCCKLVPVASKIATPF